MASQYLLWKAKDEKPREERQLTSRERRLNWWHYHKWHVIIAAILLCIAADILSSALHLGQVMPDVEVAYVGSTLLSEETISQLESALAVLTSDGNGDR